MFTSVPRGRRCNTHGARGLRFLVVLISVVAIGAVSAAGVDSARNQSSRVDDFTYVSPSFGYGLGWNASWEVMHEEAGYLTDSIALTNGVVTFSRLAYFEDGITLEKCQQNTVGFMLLNYSEFDFLVDDNGQPFWRFDAQSTPARYELWYWFGVPTNEGLEEFAMMNECRLLVPGQVALVDQWVIPFNLLESTAYSEAQSELSGGPFYDADGDLITDQLETLLGTDPSNPDTDFDGYWDGDEMWVFGTDFLSPDSGGLNSSLSAPNTGEVTDLVGWAQGECSRAAPGIEYVDCQSSALAGFTDTMNYMRPVWEAAHELNTD